MTATPEWEVAESGEILHISFSLKIAATGEINFSPWVRQRMLSLMDRVIRRGGGHESWITFNNIQFNSAKWLTLQVWWWEIGGTRIGKTGQGLQGESHQYGSLPTDNNSGTHPGLRWNSMGISSLASCWLHWAEATGAIIETIMYQLYFWKSLPFLLNSRSCQEWTLTMVSTLTKGVILNSTLTLSLWLSLISA